MIEGMLGSIYGLRIIENSNMVIQFRFPRSKKRRIRKKWKKNPINLKPATYGLYFHDTFTCHPVLAQAIKEQIRLLEEKENRMADKSIDFPKKYRNEFKEHINPYWTGFKPCFGSVWNTENIT